MGGFLAKHSKQGNGSYADLFLSSPFIRVPEDLIIFLLLVQGGNPYKWTFPFFNC